MGRGAAGDREWGRMVEDGSGWGWMAAAVMADPGLGLGLTCGVCPAGPGLGLGLGGPSGACGVRASSRRP